MQKIQNWKSLNKWQNQKFKYITCKENNLFSVYAHAITDYRYKKRVKYQKHRKFKTKSPLINDKIKSLNTSNQWKTTVIILPLFVGNGD